MGSEGSISWNIFDTRKPCQWYESLAQVPVADIYYLPEYHKAHELNGDGEAYLFVARRGSDTLIYPFFVRPITNPGFEKWSDIETVYGYGGPLSTTKNPDFLSSVWDLFSEWSRENHLVAEFIRFHPLLSSQENVTGSCEVVLNRETVAVSLDCSEDQLWEDYPSVQRNMVRKALKAGLSCEECDGFRDLVRFRELYVDTMRRLDADDYYSFSGSYFDYLCDSLSGRIRLFQVRDKKRVVAAALFMLYEDKIHYHLAGSDFSYRKYAPNNLLLHTVAEWARARGFRSLHLGGGQTVDPCDPLLRFKASISHSRFPFYIGKRVHNPTIYQRLCIEWMKENNIATRPDRFLLYRSGETHGN